MNRENDDANNVLYALEASRDYDQGQTWKNSPPFSPLIPADDPDQSARTRDP
jgi:hypothetical protein